MSEDFCSVRDLTVPGVLSRQAEKHGEKIFLTYLPDGRTFTFSTVDVETNRLARGLQALGIGRGSHVAMLMANSPEFVLLSLAIGKLGAVAIPINTGCKGLTLAYFVENSDAEIVIVDGDLIPAYAAIAGAGSRITRCIVVGETHAEIPGVSIIPYDALLTSDSRPLPIDVLCSDLFFLAYTSGTTGPSKGNMLSQAAALTLGLSTARHHGFRPDDVFYVSLPLFHINALQVATYGALLTGASVALARRFSASRFWDDIRSANATVTNLLGSMTSFLWNQTERPDDAENPLRIASAVPTPAFARAFERRFGLRLISNYGLSDFAMVTGYTIADPPGKLGSAGRARKGFQIRIADDNDFPLPAGGIGEILMRADAPWTASTGYYNMPEATMKAFRNQWFHSGDRGYLDEEGFLYFVDRAKDSIRRRGENISAFEVEKIVDMHPAVQESAAFPVAAADSEEEVAIVIVPKPGRTVWPEEVISFCEQNMPRHMLPRYIVLRDELPRTLSQKVEKYRLRAEIEADLSAAWDRGDGRAQSKADSSRRRG